MIKLSRRLRAVASLVTEGNTVADIGTDHAYVPIYLCLSGIIPSAVAVDVKEGPLKRAEANIEACGLTGRISTRLSDGLLGLDAGEADTVIIAGMGGALTERILLEGEEKLSEAKELVLQPQSEIFRVRRRLSRMHWLIVDENIVADDGKYYPMFRAVPGYAFDTALCGEGKDEAYAREIKTTPDEAEVYYGKVLIQRSPEVLSEYLRHRLSVDAGIISGIAGSGTEDAMRRCLELKREMSLLNETLEKVDRLRSI